MTRKQFRVLYISVSAVLVTLAFIIPNWDYVFGEPYKLGNNTVANVTASIDLNDESLADSYIRYINIPTKNTLTEADLDWIIRGENKTTEEEVKQIICPDNFTAETMDIYYKCMNK